MNDARKVDAHHQASKLLKGCFAQYLEKEAATAEALRICDKKIKEGRMAWYIEFWKEVRRNVEHGGFFSLKDLKK